MATSSHTLTPAKTGAESLAAPVAGTGLARRLLSSGPGVLVAQIAVGIVHRGGGELASGTWIDSFFISKPSLVVVELWRQIASGTLAKDLWVTIVQETLTGYAIGASSGIVFGFLLAQAP